LAERRHAEDAGNANWRRAVSLLDGLAESGARHVVISPGSRSTPLALAAARCSAFTLHVIPDERAAGFFALGLARATGRPAILVGTSGSAPAHWLPAAIEACEDEQPMLLVSADRPPELLDCGANQATAQGQLFAAHARACAELPADASTTHARDLGRRAAAASLWPRPGPVHINAAWREPLVPAEPGACRPWTPGPSTFHLPRMATPDLRVVAATAARLGGRRGAILAGRLMPGDPAAGAIAALAAALDCAVIADPLSGLRAGEAGAARVLCAGDAFLRDPDAPCPDWLLRVGKPPVSRHVETWADRCADTILLAAGPPWSDPLRRAGSVLLGDPAATLAALAAAVARAGLKAAPWDALDQREAAMQSALAALPARPLEAELVRAIAAAAPAATPVFVANSLVVRDFDSFLPRCEATLPLYANRGVSGIDGNLSTAAGVIAGTGRAGIAVLGDLALFHDLNALSLCAGLPIVVVVVNNGGGAIFRQLPQGDLPEFEQLWLTPPGIEPERAAALFGLRYVRHERAAGLEAAIVDALGAAGPVLLELVVEREASHSARQAWWATSGGRREQGEK
jgi:2-succinyl-5-enolpyruvyl-6-hydroxy-3-cyclohexene-1-carboxylate synthase